MSYPKFSVGEEVLIYSKNRPNIQGVEATVTGRSYDDFYSVANITGEVIPPEYSYYISPDPVNGRSRWSESALRRRPSDFTFNELMDSLKTPIPA